MRNSRDSMSMLSKCGQLVGWSVLCWKLNQFNFVGGCNIDRKDYIYSLRVFVDM